MRGRVHARGRLFRGRSQRTISCLHCGKTCSIRAMAVCHFTGGFWSTAFYVRGVCRVSYSWLDSRAFVFCLFHGRGIYCRRGGDRGESVGAGWGDAFGDHVSFLGTVSSCTADCGEAIPWRRVDEWSYCAGHVRRGFLHCGNAVRRKNAHRELTLRRMESRKTRGKYREGKNEENTWTDCVSGIACQRHSEQGE